jgi:glutamine---fructose-6-phosphate transaminase (isomerizing)
MCGIFGVVGADAGAELLIESLKRLEYRGYDSWGIALGGADALTVSRHVGRIGLAQAADLAEMPSESWGGICHTRWATHGAPTVANAHPHCDCTGRIAVVHNGIIENYRALRTELEGKGHTFHSETDTEVVGHLIEEFCKRGTPVDEAFLDAAKLLEGAYGLVVMDADSPGALYVARRGSPMVIGISDDAMFVSSDPASLVAHTRRVVYLEDGEAAVLRADSYRTHDLDAVPVSKEVEEIAFDLPAIERGGFEHFMLKEIFEQPETVLNAMRGRMDPEEGVVRLGGLSEDVLRKTRRCHILACGTSWHAALVGKYLIENLARVPTQVSYAAEFRYINPVIEPETLVIAVSQSGETLDTLAGLREAKLRGATVAGICNTVGSTIARETGRGIFLRAGPEIGVASTKAFTGQVAVLALLAVRMGRLRDMSLTEAQTILRGMATLPEKIRAALDCDAQVRAIAEEFADCPNFLYIGRLYEYPLALEGALKLKEISYIHAEGIPAAELKHGPIALVDAEMPTVVCAMQAAILEKMLGNVEEIRARGGRIIAFTREGETRLDALAEHVVHVPAIADPLVPIVGAVPLQLLAYHIAIRRGCDVDHPRNLAKSVTVE